MKKRVKNKSLVEYDKKIRKENESKIKAAIQTLKNNYKSVTMTAIAKEIGMSRANLYRYKEFIEKCKDLININLTPTGIEALLKENKKLKSLIAKKSETK